MTDVSTLAALLRTAAPHLAIGPFLEEAATALLEYDELLTKSKNRVVELEEANDELGEANGTLKDDIFAMADDRETKALGAPIFSDYLVSIGLPAVPVSCANPHLEALAELLLP